jgi:hypothetical protein
MGRTKYGKNKGVGRNGNSPDASNRRDEGRGDGGDGGDGGGREELLSTVRGRHGPLAGLSGVTIILS